MASDLEIHPLRPEEVAPAVALLRRQFDEHDIALGNEALERSVRALGDDPALGRVLVAVDGAAIVGVAVLTFLWTLEHGGPGAWLDELYVDPAQRRRGIGRRLTQAALAVAAERGAVALDLEVEEGHDEAERLYRSMGFQRHRRVRWARRFDGARIGPTDEAPHAAPPPRAGHAAAGDAHRPFASLDHLSLGVSDLARAKAFYDRALAPLGLVAHATTEGELAYGPPGSPAPEGFAFYIGFEDPAAKREVRPSAGMHVAFRAPSRAAVRAFHAAALAAGGRDLGAPGLRPQYHASYYGAFVADPDGHHVEAVCHAPEERTVQLSPRDRSPRARGRTP